MSSLGRDISRVRTAMVPPVAVTRRQARLATSSSLNRFPLLTGPSNELGVDTTTYGN
jgi:hypothetical protein